MYNLFCIDLFIVECIDTPESSEEVSVVNDTKMSDPTSSLPDHIESCEIQCETPSDVQSKLPEF